MKTRLAVKLNAIAALRQIKKSSDADFIEGLLTSVTLAEAAGAGLIALQLGTEQGRISLEEASVIQKNLKSIPLRLEIFPQPSLVRFAVQSQPEWVSLFPEKKGTKTKKLKNLKKAIGQLKQAKIKVSCLIEPKSKWVQQVHDLGADAVQLHSGAYCVAAQSGNEKTELEKIRKTAALAKKLGMEAHLGYGLNYANVRKLAELETSSREHLIKTYVVGHSLVCRATLVGLTRAIREMVSAWEAP